MSFLRETYLEKSAVPAVRGDPSVELGSTTWFVITMYMLQRLLKPTVAILNFLS